MFAGMTLTHLLLAAGALLLFASAIYGLVLLDRHTQAKQDEHKGVDETGLADLLAQAPSKDLAEPHVPVTAELNLVHIERSPLARHCSDVMAVNTNHIGQHRAAGLRDPNRPLLNAETVEWGEKTEEFAKLAELITGEPLTAVGPREADLRQLDLEGIS